LLLKFKIEDTAIAETIVHSSVVLQCNKDDPAESYELLIPFSLKIQ